MSSARPLLEPAGQGDAEELATAQELNRRCAELQVELEAYAAEMNAEIERRIAEHKAFMERRPHDTEQVLLMAGRIQELESAGEISASTAAQYRGWLLEAADQSACDPDVRDRLARLVFPERYEELRRMAAGLNAQHKAEE